MCRKIISPVNEILHRTLVAKKSVPKSFDELHVSLFFWSKKNTRWCLKDTTVVAFLLRLPLYTSFLFFGLFQTCYNIKQPH